MSQGQSLSAERTRADRCLPKVLCKTVCLVKEGEDKRTSADLGPSRLQLNQDYMYLKFSFCEISRFTLMHETVSHLTVVSLLEHSTFVILLSAITTQQGVAISLLPCSDLVGAGPIEARADYKTRRLL